jgi:hypothetical protein
VIVSANEVRLEHTGHLNRELLDVQGSVFDCLLLALPALLHGFRRWLLLFLGHGLPLRFRGLVDPAMSVVGAAALGC